MGAISVPNARSLLGLYNVQAYGADPTGTFDATADIQAALDAAGTAGAECYVPPGIYAIGGSLNVPNNVQFVGPWAGAPQFLNNPGPGGAQLYITGGSGSGSGTPTISLNDRAVMAGLAMYWPNQLVTATTPTAYPWAISMVSTQAGTPQASCEVRDCSLVNPYQGIRINNIARARVQRIYGQPLSVGVSVESVADICRLSDIHFVYLWANPGSNAQVWQQANGTAFRFGRSDEQRCDGLFALSFNVGVELYNQTTGTNTGSAYGTFVGCSMDSCNTSVLASSTSFQGVRWIGGGIASLATNVSLSAGAVGFSGVRFWSSATPTISHTGGDLSFDDCRVYSQMSFPSSGDTFRFTNNVLKNTASTIALSGSGKATLVGNTLTGAAFSSIVSGTMSGGTVTGSNN